MTKAQFQRYKGHVASLDHDDIGSILVRQALSTSKNAITVRLTELPFYYERLHEEDFSKAQLRWHCGQLELRCKRKNQPGWKESWKEGSKNLFRFEEIIGLELSEGLGLELLLTDDT